ncbi:MAG: hypothetical protein LAQ30_29515 [Acidobacteriia bacterium]|nr:hypothetical protein [Terriglobia bacterium]
MENNRCEKLRWKGMFIESVPDPSIQPANDGSFWCQHTFTCVGPDGKVANEEECNAARPCYEEL